jgi:hypothetical protein
MTFTAFEPGFATCCIHVDLCRGRFRGRIAMVGEDLKLDAESAEEEEWTEGERSDINDL